jgi:hypothetical protein
MNRFRSAIDAWLVALLVCVLLLPVVFPEWTNLSGRAQAIAIMAMSAGFIVLLTWPCEYTLRDNDLHIRCGLLIKKSIGYTEINAAQKSRNPLSAPALSLRRVRIDHGNGYTLISPKDRELFIEELMKRVRNATQQPVAGDAAPATQHT